MLETCSEYCGWFAALVAVICFGSFGVPMKSKASNSVNVDPLVFQSYKTLMCFLVSFSVLLLGYNPTFTPWGIVSGFFWVPAGVAGIYAVRKAGLAISQGIWSSAIVVVSYFWGVVVFREDVKSIIGSCSAGLILTIGLCGLSKFSAPDRTLDISDKSSFDDHALIASNKLLSSYHSIREPTIKSVHGDVDEDDIDKSPQKLPSPVKTNGKVSQEDRYKGLLAAIFNGVWVATMLVPLHYSREDAKGMQYSISFGCGAMIVLVLIWIIRFIYVTLVVGSFTVAFNALPSFHMRTMWKSGCLAGILWAVGNICGILCITSLGYAIGFCATQSAMLISGAWGIFFFKEVQTKEKIRWWFISAVVTLIGIIWLSQELRRA